MQKTFGSPCTLTTTVYLQLDSEALQQYAMKLSRHEKGRDGSMSPYLISQIPVPPKRERTKSAKSPRRSARMSARPDDPHKRSGVRVGSHTNRLFHYRLDKYRYRLVARHVLKLTTSVLCFCCWFLCDNFCIVCHM